MINKYQMFIAVLSFLVTLQFPFVVENTLKIPINLQLSTLMALLWPAIILPILVGWLGIMVLIAILAYQLLPAPRESLSQNNPTPIIQGNSQKRPRGRPRKYPKPENNLAGNSGIKILNTVKTQDYSND